MLLSSKVLESKLDTYSVLISMGKGEFDELAEIRELKYDLYSYLLQKCEGIDVAWCDARITEISKKLKRLGCEGFLTKIFNN